MMWIPIIGWVLAPILLFLSLAVLASALLPSRKQAFHCQGCKRWFSVPKADLPARA